MATIAVIISIVALVGAGFAFIRAASSHHILGKRIEDLKERVKYLEENQNRMQAASNRGNKPVLEQEETGRRNQPRQEQQKLERQEPRQKQRERQPQQERSQQERQAPQQERQQQERQAQQPERQQQERRPQEKQQPQQQDALQQEQQQKRKKENRRRNEPRERSSFDEPAREQQLPASNGGIRLEIAGSDLLDELEQEAGFSQPTPMPEPEVMADSGIRYAIIPEDGVIRQHHLQRQPDSDSYIEMDVPAEGSSMTHYRFNLGGNHAFVISQGIERLENAFDFEKPSNRMVSRIVQQQDGVLTKVNNGWRIQEKARIDFR